MSTIFDSQPGRLVSLPSTTPKSFRLVVDGYGELPGIATQVTWGGSVSAQVLTSLANTVHVTSFGDKPGSLQVSVILNESCSAEGSSSLDNFLAFYSDNRLAAAQYGGRIDPLSIVIGRRAYWGYLMGYQNQAAAEGVQLITGTLSFVAWLA